MGRPVSLACLLKLQGTGMPRTSAPLEGTQTCVRRYSRRETDDPTPQRLPPPRHQNKTEHHTAFTYLTHLRFPP